MSPFPFIQNEERIMYDIIVVGAGPAGLTAALYARRAEKSVLVLEKSTFGGQMTFSPKIENYPGFLQLSGNELADKMVDSTLAQGAEIDLDTVTGVRKEADGTFTVVGESGERQARAVILALGAKHRQLGLPRENELVGEGVSYCAVCDGAFYKGLTVAVIGGGNSALQEAVLLSDTCKKVYVIQNLDYFTGEAKLVEKLKTKDNVEFIMGTVVTELVGESSLSAIKLRTGDKESELALDGIFVAIGLEPCNTPFEDLVSLNKYGYFDVDESCVSATEGIFAAGDCRSKSVRQIATAIADGASAAIAACRYLDK